MILESYQTKKKINQLTYEKYSLYFVHTVRYGLDKREQWFQSVFKD